MLFRAVLLISFLCIAICLAAKDYYEVLGVERGASTAQIKRAFKKLALKHHPDKSDDPKASEKFMEITTAYETLFNEDKRKAYDRMGHEAYVQSKKKGGTPEEEAAFTNFFRQSTASSPDHEGYFESFDKFFSGSFGPGHGGVFFGADGAPMFQSDEFLDLDDIMFNPFWNEDSGSHFGSGQSFFGGGHFKQHQQQHQRQHQHQQQFSQARNQHRTRQQQFLHEGDGFFSMFDSDFGHFSSGSQGFHSGGASKKCVTTKYRNSDGHWVESTSCTVG